MGETQIADALQAGWRWAHDEDTARDYSAEPLVLTYTFERAYQNMQVDPSQPVEYLQISPTEKQAMIEAMNAWSAVTNVVFVEARDPADAKLFIVEGGLPETATAATLTNSASSVEYAQIVFDSSKFKGPDGSEEFSVAALHELGHALGLEHPYNTLVNLPEELQGLGIRAEQSPHLKDLGLQDDQLRTVESYTAIFEDLISGKRSSNPEGMEAPDYVNPITPMMYDIIAVADMYGYNKNAGAGNSTYAFPAADLAANVVTVNGGSSRDITAQTILDTEGQDVIDASNQTSAVTIDLNPAGESRIGDSIVFNAHATQIENAIGGQQNDLIEGNAVDNRLEGGHGRDILSGRGGNDILIGGSGNDLLIGGAGADRFVFSAGDALNTQQTGLRGVLFAAYNAARNFEPLQALRHWAPVDAAVNWLADKGLDLSPSRSVDVVSDFRIGDDLLKFMHFNGVTSMQDLEIREYRQFLGFGDVQGVEVTVGDQSIRLVGLRASDLTAAQFEFAGVEANPVEPTTEPRQVAFAAAALNFDFMAEAELDTQKSPLNGHAQQAVKESHIS